MKLWILQAFGCIYGRDYWTYLGVYDSRERAKAEAERVTPHLTWNDEDNDSGCQSTTDVSEAYQGVNKIRRWLIEDETLNEETFITSWNYHD